MNRRKVYRAGLMTPGRDAGAAARVTGAADGRRLGTVHPPRVGSLFAAPTLPGVVRWVLGNSYCRFNTRVREITVDADTVWVYRVAAWERIRDERDLARIDDYWATGMTLTDWLGTDGLNAAEWEVLVRPSDVLAVRNVSVSRLIAAAPDWRGQELRTITRGWRYAA